MVGEILAGVVLGPALLGRLPLMDHLFHTARHPGHILTFVYWLGLLLLMFVSGTEMQQLFGRGERRTVGWLIIVGTGTPFLLGLVFGPHLIGPSLAGPHGNRPSLIIILAVGVAVTSVPVVSKIFADLNILDTRFARLVLGVAVLEDIVLWLALAVATALATNTALNPWRMSLHLCLTVVYFVVGLTAAPRIIKRLNTTRWNAFARQSPTGYVIAVLLAYCAVAGALDVNLVFAAFLAGFAVMHKKRRIFDDAIEAIGKVFLRLLHSRLLRGRRAETGPHPRSLTVDDHRIHRRHLRGQDGVGRAGRPVRRFPGTRADQPWDHHQRPRRPGHCVGQRRLRRRHHQLEVLLHAR